MSLETNLKVISDNNKTITQNEQKVYKSGRLSVLKEPSSMGYPDVLTDCLDAPLIAFQAEVVNASDYEIILTSETGETQKVSIPNSNEVFNIYLNEDGSVFFEQYLDASAVGYVDYTNTDVGKAIKALHTYAGKTYVTGLNYIKCYRDVRQVRYEEGEKAGKANESAKIDYNFKRSKAAVCMRGGEIDMNAEIDKLPDAILNIPIDASIGFYSDEDTAHQKIVPEGAEDYALLKQLGGATCKCNNLIPFPYPDVPDNLKDQIIINENGSITVKDLTDSEAGISWFFFKKSLPAGDYTYNKGGTELSSVVSLRDGGNSIRNNIAASGTFSISKEEAAAGYEVWINIYVKQGTSVSGSILPMLNYGTTAFPHELYYEDLRDTKVTEIVSHGANIFNPAEIIKAQYSQNTTLKDDVFTTNFSTGTLYVNATKTVIFPKGTYTLTINSTSGDMSLVVYLYPKSNLNTIKQSKAFEDFTTATFTFTIDEDCALCFGGYSGHYGTYSYRVKLQRGNTTTEYTPYREPISYPIPEAVQALEGYGLGIDATDYNYIECIDDKKRYVQKVKEIVLTGSEKMYLYTYNNTNGIRIIDCLDEGYNRAKAICSDTDKMTGSDFKPNAMWVGVNGNKSIYWVGILDILGITTVDEFEAYLADRYAKENPVRIIYKLATPIETYLPEAFDNFIKVEGGGTLEFVNEHKNAVSSTIKYTVKVGA